VSSVARRCLPQRSAGALAFEVGVDGLVVVHIKREAVGLSVALGRDRRFATAFVFGRWNDWALAICL
jgi:hypothetical protein